MRNSLSGRGASSALRRPNERPHVEMSLRGDSVNEVRNIFSEIHVDCEMLPSLSLSAPSVGASDPQNHTTTGNQAQTWMLPPLFLRFQLRTLYINLA